MDRTRPVAALLIVLLTAPVVAGGQPAVVREGASAPETARDAYLEEVEEWWRKVEEGLRSPDGWLTLTGLDWLREGENRFGSAPDNEIVLPAVKAPARAGVLRLAGGKVTLEAVPGAGFVVDGKPVTTLELASDKDGKPTVVELGPLRFHIVHRGGRLGVRARDREHPALAAFAGVERFPVDPSWRVEARFEPYDPPKPVPVPNVLGQVEEEPSHGAVVFEREGRTWRLDAVDGKAGTELWLIFGDATNGTETYGGGRFLSTEPEAGGRVVVDFNKAYNPPCMFTPYATCPLPPRQNKLALRVAAGEKTWSGGHHADL